MTPTLDTPFRKRKTVLVLVVDDTAPARLIVQRTLDQLGYSTVVATDGGSALQAIRDHHPDALVTDLEMPGMDGEQLIEVLRQHELLYSSHLPIIVCSSKADRDTLDNLIRLRVDAVVPKPINISVLADQAAKLFPVEH